MTLLDAQQRVKRRRTETRALGLLVLVSTGALALVCVLKLAAIFAQANALFAGL